MACSNLGLATLREIPMPPACKAVKDSFRDYRHVQKPLIGEEKLREIERISKDARIEAAAERLVDFHRARAYVLRSYFDTQLMLAESKGLVIRDYRQFWMKLFRWAPYVIKSKRKGLPNL